MDKNQSKYFYTASLMDEALLALLQKKDYESITVKEVCEKAGVNRSTFYLHYENMDDLLGESYELICNRFFEQCKPSDVSREQAESIAKNDGFLITPEYLVPYLNFVKQNRKVYALIMNKASLFGTDKTFKKMYGSIFTPILDKFRVPKNNQEYVFAYYMNGVLAVIRTWVKNDCDKAVEEMIGLITDLLPPSSEEKK